MRIILPTLFPAPILRELRSLQFDILRSSESDPDRLFGLSAREQRILFLPKEMLPAGGLGHQAAHGIIALDAAARTTDGFRQSVLPHLKEASGSQFEHHVTFLTGAHVEVMHLLYEDQQVQEVISIPRGTNEQFLHFSTQGLRELRDKGVILAGFTRTVGGYFVERRRAAFHLFGVVLEGELHFSSRNSASRVLRKGSTFLIPSGTDGAYRTRGPTDFLWLHVDPHAFGPSLGDELKASTLVSSEALIDYCRCFRSETRTASADRETALGHLANLIELSLHRGVTALGMNLQHDEVRERLKQVLRKIEEDVSMDYSIADLARFAGVSISRLYREAKRCFNRSPGTLLEEIRMRHARELLLHSDYKLEKIAEMTGYADAFSFSRAFKRFSGTVPSALRKGRSRKPE